MGLCFSSLFLLDGLYFALFIHGCCGVLCFRAGCSGKKIDYDVIVVVVVIVVCGLCLQDVSLARAAGER